MGRCGAPQCEIPQHPEIRWQGFAARLMADHAIHGQIDNCCDTPFLSCFDLWKAFCLLSHSLCSHFPRSASCQSLSQFSARVIALTNTMSGVEAAISRHPDDEEKVPVHDEDPQALKSDVIHNVT